MHDLCMKENEEEKRITVKLQWLEHGWLNMVQDFRYECVPKN